MIAVWLLLALASPDRGAVALDTPDGTFVSWRLLEGEQKAEFDVLVNGRKANPSPVVNATSFLIKGAAKGKIEVRCGKQTSRAMRTDKPYFSIPLKPIPGYTANDGSVGDLDGDGKLEIVVHRTGKSTDNAAKVVTDPPILEAYRLDGRFMWRINLGKNVREGAHYTQFLVYDFDGDGRAEVACKTADGSTDGKGKVIGDPKADWRNPDGFILRGPEYLTVFDGRTGAAIDTVLYEPRRHPKTTDPTSEQLNAIWGDGYGNRCDRYLACMAYLDGEHPSMVFCRGYYTRTVLAAWDLVNGKLKKRWVFDSFHAPAYSGQGNHNLSVADVDQDGKDEIVYGSCTIDDDGKGLYSTGLGHGDALHVSDLDPTRPGLEVYAVHERPKSGLGVTFRDAKTGEILWSKRSKDVGRGVALDIDPRYPGSECWSSRVDEDEGLWSAKGVRISAAKPRETNFGVYWDGDPLQEILDKNYIAKWDWLTSTETTLLTAEGCVANNSTKATPVLCADILGDWREEVVWRTEDGKELRIYVSPIPTAFRFPWLMLDRQYRESVVWQNTGYNQPPHLSFWLMGKANATH